MAKVLFVNPIVREEDVPRHVPYGMALLAAIALREGHLVQVYDANAWRSNDTTHRQVLEADDWDVVALGGITTAYGSIKNLIGLVEELALPAVCVLGGGVLTSLPREMMAWLGRVDVGVIGEAFETFLNYMMKISGGILILPHSQLASVESCLGTEQSTWRIFVLVTTAEAQSQLAAN